jgi:hypothetical protein
MIVEKPAPVTLDISPRAARGIGLAIGASIPLLTIVCYDLGIPKEMARQTALHSDSRCYAQGPWSRDCRQAVAEVAASRVAGWVKDSR